MRSRRFLLLAATLVALNTALWLAPQGLALRQAATASLFGKAMVRVDVTENNGTEFRLARGIVLTNSGTQLTVQEADTKVETITVAPSVTKVTAGGTALKLKAVKPGWHVLVTWPAPSGTADSIVVEKRGH